MANGHKRPPAPAIALVLIAALALGGYALWRSRQAATSGSLSASGSVEATEYQVAPAMAGRVTTVTVGEGDAVKAGQVLVTLDDTAFRLQLAQAEQGVKAAEAQVRIAKDGGKSAEVDAAKARLEAAKASVELAKVQLGYATVTAPHDGVVVAIATNAGQNASPGRTLLTLTDPADLFVRVFVPETRLGDVKLGGTARVSTDAAGSATGRVEFISSSSEFTPNNVETKEQRVKLVYEVRVRISDGSGTLKAGMPVDVSFE